MRHTLLFMLCLITIIVSCDDGDVFDVELEFDKELQLCGDEDSDNYVVYDIRTDPFESLTLLFPGSAANDLIFNPTQTPYTGSFAINGSSVRFNYRMYDGNPDDLICEEIPASDVTITEDYESTSGMVTFTTTYIDDDNDGIPTEDENPDPNMDGNYDDAQDSDGDGIPDYLDEDDDNDNIPTRNEDDDLDDDDNPFTNPRNTDGDGLPDFLDNDDDGDGVITRFEDEDGDGSPLDDIPAGETVPRFLDNTYADEFVNDIFLDNAYTRTITVEFIITDIDIDILSADVIELGTYTQTLIIDE